MVEATATPSIDELVAKEVRLTEQVSVDTNVIAEVEANIAKAMKANNLDDVLTLSDARTEAKVALVKTESQLATAVSAIASAKFAANADKVAAIHDAIGASEEVNGYFTQLEAYGITRVTLERSGETGKMLVNSLGPTPPKKTRASGGGGGNGRGQTMTVDGQTFPSASAALKAYFPDSGPLNRDSIASKLTGAGHTVS